MKYLAQIEIGPPGGFRGIGPLGLEGIIEERTGFTAIEIFNKVISGTVALLTIIAAIWFIFIFISGAISIITSGGDKTKLTQAKDKLTTGIIGLVVVIAGVFIIDFIGSLLGFNILRGARLIPEISP